jgi:hypothetical protein
MNKHLNGWQRLWVVLVVLYLVPVVLINIDALPTASDYARTRLHDSIDLAGKHMESTTPGYTFEGSYTVREKYYADLTDEQIIERLHTKFKDKVDFTKIESEYHRKISGLGTEQAKTVGYAILWWLLPSALLYLFGVAVAWVIRGFRGERPSP